MERTWVTVAFGDIRGFGPWISRAANSREVKEPFILSFYDILQDYVNRNSDVYFKYIGDGFMALRESKNKDSKDVFGFVDSLKGLSKKIVKLIRSSEYPQPDGFRIRVASGDVYTFKIIDPNDPNRERKVHEYTEYAINEASHLLKVNPEIAFMVTESVAKALGPHRSAFRMRKIERPSAYPESVNRIDIESLNIVQI